MISSMAPRSFSPLNERTASERARLHVAVRSHTRADDLAIERVTRRSNGTWEVILRETVGDCRCHKVAVSPAAADAPAWARFPCRDLAA
jgi:hypothetical protein